MLYPSIDEMMNKVDSKYSLVVAASRRARQLREGAKTDLKHPRSHKYVGVALEEIYGDMIRVVSEPVAERDEDKA
ncbi:DNA-directed RNA polymerase subunit omega [Paenibacillus rhizosphaerae]|uniref:DNA-directed RNA polymerase subunit omega n=1 Tax=Paenibacillus rhizosphaerae TaxID=297318 RepID=A0A839TKX5_9BACL|nr:DNA-directed RNA polymerase subunit omega [Paenibacillus rhizosphaerae]MBB3127464.1 DNA-directed RNA polymerase subunit omega [Paenibacillus rhizosphaerae]